MCWQELGDTNITTKSVTGITGTVDYEIIEWIGGSISFTNYTKKHDICADIM